MKSNGINNRNMERKVITLDEYGRLHVPETPGSSIWMGEPELVELFGVVAPTLRAAVRAVYKSGIVTPHEAERRVSLPDGNRLEVYGITLIIALAFRLDTCGARRLRDYVIGRFGASGGGGKGMQLLIVRGSRHTGYA